MSDSEIVTAKEWPIDRRKELAALQDLLREARMINHGSGAIERMQEVIRLAEALTRLDLKAARPSFMDFLIQQAAGG